ncbi:U-box domain-containing protein 35-like [Rosa sericea]
MRREKAENSTIEAVAVAINKDRGSHHAFKWTVENLLTKDQSLTLVHVKQITSANSTQSRGIPTSGEEEEAIKCNEVVIENPDVPKALINYVSANLIDILALGAPSTRYGLLRFKSTNVSSTVSKAAPEFCTVYVVGKGKLSYVRSANCCPHPKAPSCKQIQHQSSNVSEANKSNQHPRESQRTQYLANSHLDNIEIKSPFTRGNASMNKSYELSTETDISFVSSGRPSTDCMFPAFSESPESGPRHSISSYMDYRRPSYSGGKFIDMSSSQCEVSSSSIKSGNSWLSQNMDEMEAEMRRLRLELKRTMDMYSTACKEALTEKQKAMQLHRLKMEEKQRLEEAQEAEEAALKLAEKEKAKCQAAMDAAEAAKRIAEAEAQQRRNAEMKALKEAKERMKALGTTTYDPKYRRYTIEEIEVATNNFSHALEVGEGGYGPVYRGELDHTPVAIKVLRSDAAQGWSQFQQEVHILSCIRHPNIILLLGACPENGCLVYEYMDNGSLEDRLFRQGNTPVIPWQLRFQIAADIGTGLLFLHQTKPEPLVHRDLKPGNILLDYNYVGKICDVGLARLVPPSVADSITQYHMTSAAGTFCYIDPEYQQTGMLGIKSDIYSLGVMFLQLITAKPPMGLTHHVERAIEKGTFSEMLDPAVPDWPVEEALCFAKLGLQCAEMRRKDRPDLGKVVLPELNRLRKLGEDSMNGLTVGNGEVSSARQVSTLADLALHLK